MARSIATIFVALCVAPALAAAAGPALHPHDQINNWGVWGKDDEKGAANYITPERIVAAAKLIQTGKSFSLAIPIDASGPVHPLRMNPHHTMALAGVDAAAGVAPDLGFGDFRFADDYIYMALQGSTQWDGLSHAWYGGSLYNGVPESAVRSAPYAGGATKLGIENLKESLIGRGVLIDVVAYKGGELPKGYSIRLADIQGALARQETEVLPGDIVLVRTGEVPRYYKLQTALERIMYWEEPQVGLASDVVPWIKEKQIAAIAADNVAFERMPNEDDPSQVAPLHGNLLRDMGVYIGEIWWLEELAADCAEDGRYSFFLAAQPLNVTGAVGSPLNPVAIK